MISVIRSRNLAAFLLVAANCLVVSVEPELTCFTAIISKTSCWCPAEW